MVVIGVTETKKQIKASVVLSNLSAFLGWGGNPYVETLRSLVVQDSSGYITETSITNLNYRVTGYIDRAKDIKHKKQLEKFSDYLDCEI